ncbi:MAG: 6-bladed beta-propeller [Balneolaceae bacterium]
MKYSLLCGVKILFVSLLVSCAQQAEREDEITHDFSVISDTLLIFDDQAEVVVGRVRDIALGPNGSIYLLDSSNNTVKVFDHNGNLSSEMLTGQGRGPGETINPNSIFVDLSGNLYVTDLSQNKILVLNTDNQLIAEAVLPLRPSKILAINPDNLFIIGFRFSYSGNLIHHYSRINSSDYELTSTFAERGAEGESREVSMSGWSDLISIDSEENIYVGRFFPYHIDVYTAEKDLVHTIKRDLDFITKPQLDRSSGMVTVSGVAREPLPLPGGLLLIRYFEMNENQNRTSYFDLYNNSGELIITKTFEELGISEKAEYFVTDTHSNEIYAGFNDPYPGLIKYVIDFK